jgi:hypothetical protein
MPHPQPSNHAPAPRSHTRVIGDQCERCLYCHGLRITREGKRYKKLETIQLWRCHDCHRVFTPQIVTGKTFPLAVILEALMRYYRGDTRARCRPYQGTFRHAHQSPDALAVAGRVPGADHLCASGSSAAPAVPAAPAHPFHPAALSLSELFATRPSFFVADDKVLHIAKMAWPITIEAERFRLHPRRNAHLR